MQDIPLGDKLFDEAFVLKAENTAVARRLMSEDARERMQWLLGTWITSKPKRIELVGTGRWEDPKLMRNAIELVGVLASTDLYGVAALRAVGDVTQPEGERPRVVVDTGARVVVMAEDRDDRLVMSARVYEPGEHEPLVLEVIDGRAELAAKLPQGAQLHLARAGSGTLTIGNTLAFHWRELELDPDRLRAGAELLGAIAAGARGVYR
jgi:hypothetical protein